MKDDADREIEASWRTNADAWTTAVRGELIESRRVATNDAVIEAVLQRRPRAVLDVGCGEGWLAHRLAGHGVRVSGFDSSERLVDAARAGTGSFQLLSYAEFAARPALAGTDYDVVVCNFSLLGRDVAAVLRACHEVLTSGGALIIQTVHPAAVDGGEQDGWRREHYRGLGVDFSVSMPWFFRTVDTWKQLLQGAEFELSEVRQPKHPSTQQPLSLLLIASKAGAGAAPARPR